MTWQSFFWLGVGLAIVAIAVLIYECAFSLVVWTRLTTRQRRLRIILVCRGSCRRGWIVEQNGKAVAILRSPHTPDQFWTDYRMEPLIADAKHIQFWHENMSSLEFCNRLTGTRQRNVIPGPDIVADERGFPVLSFRGLWVDSVHPTLCERNIAWRYQQRLRHRLALWMREHAVESHSA